MKTIAALITVFNRKNKTLQCLQGLFSQILLKGYAVDVFLVDDGCTDGTPEAVKKQFPTVNIIQGDGQLYWNRGMHLAWETAAKTRDYDFYLWLNDDTLIERDALSVLLQTSENFQNRAVIVGSLSAWNDRTSLTYGGRLNARRGALCSPYDRPQPCDYFNGNLVLIPRFVYRIVGKNDQIFHHALGDFDYGLRAKKMGIQLIVAPSLLGRCDEHDTLSVWCDPRQPFRKRWKAFRSPLGQNPEEFFVFERRHHGLAGACFHYFTNHLRACFPWIWSYKK